MLNCDLPELPPATLFCYPAGLALPTADPHALAVECMLRFAGAHYVKRDAPLPVAVEVGAGPAARCDEKEVARRNGVAACLQLIETNVPIDAEVLPEERRPFAQCITMLILKSLFPAFIYIAHKDEGLFNHCICKGVVPKVATLWQRLRGTYRDGVLKGATCCGRYIDVGEAVSEVEQGLSTLEMICAAAKTKTTGLFILGTERPCSVDAFAYAAASSFIHADFVGNCASPDVVRAQLRIRAACSHLVEYIERMRQLYFEEYSAFYTLRAINNNDQPNAFATLSSEMDFYQKGRRMTIVCTVCFTLLYFVLTNANLIVGMLDAVEDEYEDVVEDDEKEKEGSDIGNGEED